VCSSLDEAIAGGELNNLICLFCGHKDDKILFEKDKLTITNTDVPIARFTMCRRCSTVYLRTIWDTKT